MTSHSSAHAWRRLRRWENQRMLSSFPNINRTQGPRGPHPQGLLPKKCRSLSFFVPGEPDLWPSTTKFKLGWDFCTMHPTVKFHHLTFNRSEVIVLTNKRSYWQTDKLTNRRRWKHPPRSAMLRRWVTPCFARFKQTCWPKVSKMSTKNGPLQLRAPHSCADVTLHYAKLFQGHQLRWSEGSLASHAAEAATCTSLRRRFEAYSS